MSYHRLALRACVAVLFAAIAGCGDAPTGSTLSRISPLGRAPLADLSAAATATLANQAAPSLCLAVSGTGSGATTSLQSCAGGATQNWNVASTAGVVKLSASGECLDAFGGSSTAGDRVGIWSCHGGGNQTFTLASTGELKVANGLCVGPDGGPAAATSLVLQPCTGSAAQKWTAGAMPVPPSTTGPTTRFTGQLGNIGTGLCLASNVSGAVSGLQSCAVNAAQTWSVPGAGTAGPMTLVANGKCLDAFGGVMNAGDLVGIYGCHGGSNQTFTLTTAGELRVPNGLCVGPRGGTSLGATLELQPCTGAASQKWSATSTAISAPAPTLAPAPAPSGPSIANEPTLPTELSVPSDIAVTGRTWRPVDGGTLREAVEMAQPGDQILLTPGVSYVGYLFLPPKSGSGWITIRTDLSAGDMPAPGVRVTPSMASRFAKIIAQGRNDPAIWAQNGSRGWRFTAVEIAPHDSITALNTLIALGWGDARSLSEIPSDLIFDRVYIHGLPNKNLDRCVLMNSARTAIVNSTVEECHSYMPYTSAIGGIHGPGPYRIENNSISGAGMGIFFGGGDPRIQDLSPSDIVIRNNRIWRPTSWQGQWGAATLLEVKHARRMLVEGNLFENHWKSTLTEYAILLKSVNQDGGASWSQATDITFRRNIIRNSPAGLNIAAKPEPHSAVPAARIKVEHNLFYNIGESSGTSSGRMLVMTGALTDIQLVNNTFLHNSVATHAMMVDGSETAPQAARIVLNNNIWTHGEWGWTGYWQGTRALNYFAGTSYQASGNVLIGAGESASRYANAAFASSIDAAGFVNASAGDFTLSSSSPLRNAGTDGSTPGVDMSALFSSTAAARNMR